MNTQQLENGKSYKYKELCLLLGEPVKSGGRNKQLQFKEWERYFTWDNPTSQKFLITSIKEVPDEKIDGRGKSEGSKGNHKGKTGKYFDNLICKASVMTGGCVACSYSKLIIEELGIFDETINGIYDKKEVEDIASALNIKKKYIVKEYGLFARKFIKDQIKKSLGRLQTAKVLTYTTYHTVHPTFGSPVELPSELTQVILDTEVKVLGNMGYKLTRQSIFTVIRNGEYEEFKEKVCDELNNNNEILQYALAKIDNYWECVRYEFCDSYTDEFTIEEYEQALLELNRKAIIELHRKLEKEKKDKKDIPDEGFGREKIYKYHNDEIRKSVLKLEEYFFSEYPDYIDLENEPYTKLMTKEK